jgi:hypothetical protein
MSMTLLGIISAGSVVNRSTADQILYTRQILGKKWDGAPVIY